MDVCACGFDWSAIQPMRETTAGGLTAGQPIDVASMAQRTLRKPAVTYLLIGLSILIFLLMTVMGGSTNTNTLLKFGAMYRPLFEAGEYWRLVTPLFLHIGLLHLMFNMYALLVLGNVVEQIYGSTRFLYLYLFSGMGGAVASALFSTAVSAGASGAIFGVAGVALIVGYRHRDRVASNFKSIVGRGIVPFVLFNLAYGLLNRGIDNYAHLGGLITGAVLAFVVPPIHADSSVDKRRMFSYGMLLPLAVILGAFFFPIKAQYEMKRVEGDFKMALSLEKEKRYDEAAAVYRRALKLRPNLPSIHNNLAVIYTRQGKFEEAEREARAAVQLGDGEAMYHQTLGAVLWHQQRLQDAADHYHRAAMLDPKNAELHAALAAIYQDQGRLGDALREWLKVKELRPADVIVDRQIEALRNRIISPKS
ncbi:MAG: rhomboid family intramembrane serine protease [Acidobacteriia bacterium]|nr:rhomboid family intramembrane serine protease [Terriglobia bacterium]